MKNVIIGNIVKFENDKGKTPTYGFVLDVVNITTELPKIFFMRDDGRLNRYGLATSRIYVLPLEEQVKIYNEIFYKYVAVPKHLKKYIKDK